MLPLTNERIKQKRLSCYQISLCILLKLFTDLFRLNTNAVSKFKLAYRLSTFMMDELYEIESMEKIDGSLHSLLEKLGGYFSNKEEEEYEYVKSLMLEMVKMISHSPDALDDVFTSFECILSSETYIDNSIDRNSMFGVFLRKHIVNYQSLFFEGCSFVYKEMKHYYEQYKVIGSRKMDVLQLNECQLKIYLNEKAVRLEKEIGEMSMVDMEDRLKVVLSFDPKCIQAYFVRYLNFLHHCEFQKAIDCLHQYHDYALKDSMVGNATQYACLHFAALHFHFGHFEHSKTALEETLRLAHQHSDHICVSMAISWLMRIYAVTNDGSVNSVLLDSIGRSKELKLHIMGCIALLTQVESELMRPTLNHGLWKNVQEEEWKMIQVIRKTPMANVSTLNMVAGANAAAKNKNQSINMEEELVLQSRDTAMLKIGQVIAKTKISLASVYQVYGNKGLENTYNQIFLNYYTKYGTAHEIATGLFRNATLCLDIGALPLDEVVKEYKRLGDVHNVLSCTTWIVGHLQLLCTIALRRMELNILEQHIVSLSSIANVECQQPTDYHIMVERLKIQLYIARDDAQMALDCIQRLLLYCRENTVPLEEASSLLLYGQILMKCSKLMPISAMPHLLNGIGMSKKYKVQKLITRGQVLLAEMFYHMGKVTHARELLHEELDYIMENTSFEIIGNTHVLFAKCLYKQKKESSILHTACTHLDHAEQLFSKIELLTGLHQVYYWKARILDKYNNISARDTASNQYLKIQLQLEQARLH